MWGGWHIHISVELSSFLDVLKIQCWRRERRSPHVLISDGEGPIHTDLLSA